MPTARTMSAQEPPLHASLEPLRWLLGTWRGVGKGHYPTVGDFEYREESTWAHSGKPGMAFGQSTWAIDDGRPLHSESGYLRVAAGRVELVLAHNFGITEISVGQIGHPLTLRSSSVVSSPTAKTAGTLARRIWIAEGVLRYELDMEAVGQPLQNHLSAELHRVNEGVSERDEPERPPPDR